MAAREACKQVLAELSADKLAVHFSVPVDTSVLTDYLAVVASPIDLQTIGTRLADARGEYADERAGAGAARFLRDVRRMFDNAQRYCKERHPYIYNCLLYTSPSPRDATLSRMPSSA